jgi:ribosomal small subunit protein bTHX
MKTRRGKIYRGSFGKSRPKHPESKRGAGKAATTSASPAKK